MATADHIQIPEDATEARKETVVGGTPQTVFDFTWPYFNAADIKVYVDGVPQAGGYTLLPTTTKEGGFLGGTVTFAAALTNKTVIIEREVALARTEDFEYPSNKLNLQALNTFCDRMVALFQQFRRLFKRTLRAPVGDTLDLGELPGQAERANLLLGFDGTGQVQVRAESGGAALSLPLAIAQGGTGSNSAAAARTALGIGAAGAVDLITNALLANMAANTVKARAANSTGVPSDVALGASQLLGRGATGDVAAIALGTGLSMSGTTLNATATSPFSSSYTSSNQTITAGGSLTLAHGLGGVPTLMSAELICLTADLGYAVNDVVPIALNTQDSSTTSSRGVVVVPDGTNLNIRFGSLAGSFGLLNKSNGTSQTITNSSWALRMRAWR